MNNDFWQLMHSCIELPTFLSLFLSSVDLINVTEFNKELSSILSSDIVRRLKIWKKYISPFFETFY